MQNEILLFLFEALILLGYVLYLVWEYSAKDVPFYIKSLTFFSWLMTFSIVLVLPIDILQSQDQSTDQETNLQSWITFFWRLLYWSNFFLSWLILPFFQDYEDSGDFHWKDRMKYSIKKNLLIYTVGIIFGIIIIIYLALKTNSQGSVVDALVGLANFFGLLLVVLLLGYGLVAIPKRYIKESNEDEMIDKCYKDAVLLDDQRTEKIFDIEELCKNLFIIQNQYVGSELEPYLMKILKLVPHQCKQNAKRSSESSTRKEVPKEFNCLNMKQLGVIHKKVKQLRFDLLRIENKFTIISEKVNYLERKPQLEETNHTNMFIKGVIKIKIIWINYMRRYYNKYIGYLFGFISLLLMTGELQVLLKSKFEYNFFSSVLTAIDGVVLVDLLLLIPLTYMIFCVYYGLFAMKISGLISFNKKHHTDAPSLMFGSINFGRVSFPLCFNYLSMTTSSKDQQTQFIKFFQRMDDFPMFESTFTIILPLMLIIMSVCNLCNVGDKIMLAVGLGQFASQDNAEVLSSLGKNILDKEREARRNSVINPDDNNQKSSLLEMSKYTAPPTRRTTNTIRNFDEILSI